MPSSVSHAPVSALYPFFLHDSAPTEIYTLSLHDALPIFILNTFLFGVIILIANILKRAFSSQLAAKLRNRLKDIRDEYKDRKSGSAGMPRPISYAVFCLKKKRRDARVRTTPPKRLPIRSSGSNP